MARQTIDEIILRLQELQLQMENAMADALPEIFKDLSQQVIDIANEINLSPSTRAQSLLEIMSLKKKISDVIVQNPLYQGAVSDLVKNYTELAKLTDNYMGLVIDSYKPNKNLYNALLKTNAEMTKDLLLGSGMSKNFGNAVGQVLKANISGKTSRTQLNNTLRKFIEGTDEEKAFLERYIKQTTNDSIMTFNREYMQSVSDDLGLEHYYYAGTIIADTRTFCTSRAGRYFTREEVESWADNNWQGKRDGTNKATIFSYAGGYNCRHAIYPISVEQYTDRIKRQGLNPAPKKPK